MCLNGLLERGVKGGIEVPTHGGGRGGGVLHKSFQFQHSHLLPMITVIVSFITLHCTVHRETLAYQQLTQSTYNVKMWTAATARCLAQTAYTLLGLLQFYLRHRAHYTGLYQRNNTNNLHYD